MQTPGIRRSDPSRQPGIYVFVALTVALVYGVTLAPSLTWSHWGSDGGDLVAAAVTGRVPHPPGFPLYFALSRAIVAVFDGDPAGTLNCLSATAAGGAALLVAATARRRGISAWSAAAAALAVGFAPWVWSQALITEVYAVATLLGSLLVYGTTWASLRGGWTWALVGLCFGFGVSTHVTLVFLLPYVWLAGRPNWLLLALGTLVGLVPYALLPLFGPWPQPWGDMSTPQGWLEFVSGRMYWGYAFSLPLADWPQRLVAWVSLSARQFTPVGALVVIAGVVQQPVQGRLRVMGAAIAWLLVSLYAIGYNSADSWVYLVAFVPLPATFLADGLEWLGEHRVAATWGLFLPAALLVLNFRNTTLASDRGALSWLEGVVDEVPRGAVVLTREDRYTFALWYAVEGARLRPDLLVVDERLWGYEPYDTFLQDREGRRVSAPEQFARGRALCEIDNGGELSCE